MKTPINIFILLILNINLVFAYQTQSLYTQPTVNTNNVTMKSCNTMYMGGSTYSHPTMYNTTPKIGYSTKYGNTFSTGSYSPASSYHGSTGPRRSPQRPYSGGLLETLADWWRMKTDSDWPGYVDNDYWEEFLRDHPEYEAEARAWFENQGLRFPGDPPDPFLEPIGDGTIPLSLLMLAYLSYNQYRKKQRHCKH